MTTTNTKKKVRLTPEERKANKQRITQAKVRARRYTERRRLKLDQVWREQVPLPIVTAVHVPNIPLPPENLVLQDLLTKRVALIQELEKLDTAIAVINRTYVT